MGVSTGVTRRGGGSASFEDVVDCCEEIAVADVSGNAADFFIVFKHHKCRHDADRLGQSNFSQNGVVEVDEADRDLFALHGGFVGRQELFAEDVAVDATGSFEDDQLEVFIGHTQYCQISGSLWCRQGRHYADYEY